MFPSKIVLLNNYIVNKLSYLFIIASSNGYIFISLSQDIRIEIIRLKKNYKKQYEWN